MYTPEKIDYELDGIGLVPEYARTPLATALAYLPEKVIDFVIQNCVFISLDNKTRGMHFGTRDFRLKSRRSIIILSNSVWSQNKKAIAFVVAHEVAHAYLKHEFVKIDDTEATNQESDADKQVIKWLRLHFVGSFNRYTYKNWQLQ